MANHIQDWTEEQVLNRPLSDLARWNENRKRIDKALFLSFFWFLSRYGFVQYQDIQQVFIGLWKAFNDVTKSHWDTRAACLNERPVPSLLSV